ncbi:acetolactate decarboxylase [Methanobrevibacter sp.]|uniref:acetolactate decarboxylase n=1 Tax=Methanobrevibacter sp. TaxID=66852 RepID=UPI002E7861B9|nr:acetolactate decarboxylase [Methanobrevibacter sp.]MEE0939296.1 acetolactate decarboxylase [Methanobrevibacter sp.]
MNKKIIFALVIMGLLAVSAANAQNSLILNNNGDDSMYQVSLMQAFMHGEYDGVITVGDLKKHGDIGLGTFEGVNGEMIILDGVVYQAAADGSINVMNDNEKIPFATITKFDEDGKIDNINASNFNDLTSQLNKEIEKYGTNNMYVIKIKGDFSNITVRSVEKQEKPYKEFTDVAAVDQKVFNHTDQTGTLVAVYFPEYMNELNMHGWHLHFMSDDKTKGGHVLGFNGFKGSGQIDEIHEFNMILPTDDSFKTMNFTENMTSKISSVE